MVNTPGLRFGPGFTTGVVAGEIVGLQLGEGAAAALGDSVGELDAAVLAPPHEAGTSTETKPSAARTPAAVTRDPDFPCVAVCPPLRSGS